MRAAGCDAKLDHQSGRLRARREFPHVAVSSNLVAFAVICIQQQSRLSLRQCDAKLFCTAGKICPWSKDCVS